MRKVKITEAYCVELGDVVDIYRAHEESMRGGAPYKRFEFLCSDPRCREKGVKIIGVNYPFVRIARVCFASSLLSV